jgi:hypothetical protein
MTQSLADEIREFLVRQYVMPAREQGHSTIEIRAGDVHRDMQLVSQMPSVCAALDAKKFARALGLELIDRQGPSRGANVFFRFHVLPGGGQPTFIPASCPERQHHRPVCRGDADRFDESFSTATHDCLIFVACVAAKRASAARAKDLYCSDWFLKARAFAERCGVPWFILSAEYGLVFPDQVIAPYDRTLNTMTVAERRSWADAVVGQMQACGVMPARAVFLAGVKYREFLGEHLRRLGVAVDVPMERLRIGEQLNWLAKH